MAVVEATDLVREYRMGQETVRALDGASLSIDGGQFVSVVGPSGAGKSTLLHVIGALDTPTSGSIVVDGTDLGSLGDDAASTFRRNKVGFIFQFFNLVPTLSAWENVALPMLLDSKSLRKAKPRAVELMERVGLGHRIDHRPSELSGGQMQRVAIARSLMMKPRILLADEPTGNLDSKTGADVLALLADVAHDDPNRLVLMVTHDPGAAAVCDRVITVRDGKVVDDPAGEDGAAAAETTTPVPRVGGFPPPNPWTSSGSGYLPPRNPSASSGSIRAQSSSLPAESLLPAEPVEAPGVYVPPPPLFPPLSSSTTSGSGYPPRTLPAEPPLPAEPVEASGEQRLTTGRRRIDEAADEGVPTQRLSVAELMALGVSGPPRSRETTDTGRHRSVR